MKRITVSLIASLVAMTAGADQFRFTGRTTADNALIADALRNVVAIGEGRFNCAKPEGVDAEIMPDTFKPPDGPQAEGTAPTVYERWNVTMCGKKRAFLLAFWPASDGGTMFRVQHPFPGDKE